VEVGTGRGNSGPWQRGNEAKLAEVKAEIEAAGAVRPQHFCAGCVQRESIKATAKSVLGQFGKVEILGEQRRDYAPMG